MGTNAINCICEVFGFILTSHHFENYERISRSFHYLYFLLFDNFTWLWWLSGHHFVSLCRCYENKSCFQWGKRKKNCMQWIWVNRVDVVQLLFYLRPRIVGHPRQGWCRRKGGKVVKYLFTATLYVWFFSTQEIYFHTLYRNDLNSYS